MNTTAEEIKTMVRDNGMRIGQATVTKVKEFLNDNPKVNDVKAINYLMDVARNCKRKTVNESDVAFLENM